MTTKPSAPMDKSTWVLGLLGVLMVSHLSFLGLKNEDKATEAFQGAAETYVTIILALMAPAPGRSK